MHIIIFAQNIMTILYEKFIGIFLCTILFLSSQIAYAATVTLSGAQISEFEQIHISGSSGSSVQTNQTDDGVTFLTYFVMTAGQVFADIGDDDAGFDWSDFDTYSQSIKNYDENPWFFSLSVKDDVNNTVSSATLELAPQEEQVFSADLLNLASRNPITEIYVTISAQLPLPGNDSVAEYELSFGLGSVNEIPLPSSIILLMSSLGGLLLSQKARKYPLN